VRILFVCTGNVCRSPMGERLTRAFLDDVLGASAAVGTSSAGTHAVVGSGMEPLSARVLGDLGGDPSDFTAQQLTGDLVNAADLTLTMTRRHRRSALKLAPRAMFRTYTLREAAGLLEGVDLRALPPVSSLDDRARALVAALGRQRATRRPAEPEADDVFDPMGCAFSVHQEAGAQIHEALVPLLQALCGSNAAPALDLADTRIGAARTLPPVPRPVPSARR
jgi:protein-tyrosine phosphatase